MTENVRPQMSPEYYQIYYVLSGKLVHHVEDFSAVLLGGDVFILPPNVPHCIEKRDKSVDFYSLSFMPEYFSGIRESNKLIADFLYYLKTASQKAILPKFNLPHDDGLFVDTILRRIMYEFDSEKKERRSLSRNAPLPCFPFLPEFILSRKQALFTPK